MTSSYFQGGEYVELLSAQGQTPASTWKMNGKITKSFDKLIKGNAFVLEGGTFQLPKTSSPSFGLTQRYLVLQLLIPYTKSFSIEIVFSDFQKIRRRLVFATAFRDTTMTTLHVQIPINLHTISRDQWINLVFDVHALTEFYFPSLTSSIRAIEAIAITGSCKLKRIFTMKDAPRCDTIQIKLIKITKVLKPGQRLRFVSQQEMKDIPKQFLFSAHASNIPVPTEYFIAANDEDTLNGPTEIQTEKIKGSNMMMKKPTNAEKIPSSSTRTRPTSSQQTQKDMPSPPIEKRTHTTKIAKGKMINSPHESPASPIRVKTADRQSSRSSTTIRVKTADRQSSRTSTTINTSRSAAEPKDYLLEEPDYASRSRAEKMRAEIPSPRIEPITLTQAENTDIEIRADSKRRKEVMAIIQSKLDLLTQDAESEEERDHKLYLQHTSLSLPYSPSSKSDNRMREDDDNVFEESPLSSPQAINKDQSKADTRYDELYDTVENNPDQLLRSPEPMKLGNEHTRKPTLQFSSSIFTFSNPMGVDEPSVKPTTTTDAPPVVRNLFDWDSILANLPPTPKSLDVTPIGTPQTTAPPSQPSVSPRRSIVEDSEDDVLPVEHTIPKYPTEIDDEEEDELSRMLAAKKKARNLQQLSSTQNEAICAVERPTTESFKPMNIDSEDDDMNYEQTDEQHNAHKSQTRMSVESASSFDFEMSPVHHQELKAVKNDDDHDKDHSNDEEDLEAEDQSSEPTGSDEEDEVSLDLTDDLESIDERHTATSPCTNREPNDEEEQSFDFGTLNCNDLIIDSDKDPRDKHSQHLVSLSVNSKRPSPTMSPSKPIHTKTSTKAPSPIDQRLASLLESTDWSQFSYTPLPKHENGSSSSIELIYDPILRCYYDPMSKKYYTLAK